MDGSNLRRKIRACDLVEYSTVPDNAFGYRLGSRIAEIFCDLHNDDSVVKIAERIMLSPEEVRERLYVKDRYLGADPEEPMRWFYEKIIGSTVPKLWSSDASEWIEKTPNEEIIKYSKLGRHERDFALMLLAASGTTIVLLVGNVGAGKTTFLNYCFHVFPEYEIFKDFVYIICDFHDDNIKRAYKEKDLDGVVNLSLSRYYRNLFENKLPRLEDIFRYTYIEENYDDLINDFPEENRETEKKRLFRKWRETNISEYNYSRIRYLHDEMKKRTVICVDNIDPLPLNQQKRILDEALYKQTWYNSIVIICIRTPTTGNLRRHINLTADRCLVKYITSPQIGSCLEKRLDLLSELLGRKDLGPYRSDTLLGASVHFSTKEKVIDFLKMVVSSFNSQEVYDFVQNVFNRNMRKILDFAILFLESGNTEVWRAYEHIVKEIEKIESAAVWDRGIAHPHMVKQVAILGKGSNYHPDHIDTLIFNLFCNGFPDEFGNNLIRYRLLSYLAKFQHAPKERLLTTYSQLGYSRDALIRAIEELADPHKGGMVEAIENVDEVEDCVVFITRAGYYYQSDFCNRLIYLQYIKDGCFIYPPLKLTSRKDSLEERIFLTATFVEYLSSRELKEKRAVLSSPSVIHGKNKMKDSYNMYCDGGKSIPRIAAMLKNEIYRIKVRDHTKRMTTMKILKSIIKRDSDLDDKEVDATR